MSPPPAGRSAWKAGLGIGLVCFTGIAWLQPREDLDPLLAAARTRPTPSHSLASYSLPSLPALALVTTAMSSARDPQPLPAVDTGPSLTIAASVERGFLESVRAVNGGPVERGAPGAATRLSGVAAGRRQAVAPGASGRVAAAFSLDVNRRTSVTMREEVPRAPPPKPSVIVEQPRAAYRPKPIFPPAAIAAGKTGSVRVRLLVAASGSVERVEVVEASPAGVFEAAVKDALSQWRFIPARDDSGKAVPGLKELSFNFNLQGGA